MLKKFFISFIFIALFVLCSCFNQKIELNADKKSGKMTIEYEINDEYFQLISIILSNVELSENLFFDPFVLIDEQTFKKSYNNLGKDILASAKLNSVSIIKNEKTGFYNGKFVISFNDFEKSLKLIPNAISGLTVKRTKEELTISQQINITEIDSDGIFGDFIEQLKEDDIDFYKLLTEKASFGFAIFLKNKIKTSTGVNLGKDGMSAFYTFKIKDLLNSDKKLLNFLISF